jgi:murein L,D-transpeptidase YcbB/YkuD
MKQSFKYVLLFIIIYSCSNKEGLDINSLTSSINKKIALQKELTNTTLAQTLNTNKVIYSDTLIISEYIKNLYSKNNQKTLWTDGFKPNKTAKSFLNIIKHSHYYGLDSNLFKINAISSIYDSAIVSNKNSTILAALDIMYSNELIKFTIYNKYGQLKKIRTDSIVQQLLIDSVIDNEIEIIKNGIETNNLSLIFDSLSPRNPFFTPLQKGLQKFFQNHALSENNITVPSMNPDSIKSYNKAREALLVYNYLDSTNYKNDSIFIITLKEFQHQHGLNNDGRIGKATAKMLSKSNKERYQLAAISLEKLRTKVIDTNSFFLANIPSFQLNIVEKNKIERQFRVVVGRLINKTPIFDAEMKYLILNPHWAIPYSISSKEILPKIKKNANEISKKGYTITDMNMKSVDVANIDWSKVTTNNFKYRITQTRSGATALGRVKFIFPNNHSVYFHDTPSKHLFKNDTRAYSHGCVRIHNPLDLAEYILTKQNPDLAIDSINSIVNSGLQKRFNLKTPIKVHIDYYTSLADTSGNIQFYNDIYGKDEMYKNVLFSKK